MEINTCFKNGLRGRYKTRMNWIYNTKIHNEQELRIYSGRKSQRMDNGTRTYRLVTEGKCSAAEAAVNLNLEYSCSSMYSISVGVLANSDEIDSSLSWKTADTSLWCCSSTSCKRQYTIAWW